MTIKKICVNCDHIDRAKSPTPRCTRNFGIDPVFGKSLSDLECKTARSDAGDCGPEGRNWTPSHDYKRFLKVRYGIVYESDGSNLASTLSNTAIATSGETDSPNTPCASTSDVSSKSETNTAAEVTESGTSADTKC